MTSPGASAPGVFFVAALASPVANDLAIQMHFVAQPNG